MREVYKIDEKIVGYINYSLSGNIIKINSVVVDENYRNKKIADKLMVRLVKLMIRNNYKCIPICSYAKNWFTKYEQYQNLLK